MGHLRNFIRAITPNPFISALKKCPKNGSILLFWNRGLGDIPLELFALTKTIFEYVQDAKITIITRQDLYQGFTLLDPKIKILVSCHLKRKQFEDYDKIFEELKVDKASFHHIFYKPDPAYWVKKQKKGLLISLRWKEAFFKMLPIETAKPKAFLHIHSETVYGFEKNLPSKTWHKIIFDLKQKGYYTIALGFEKTEFFDVDCDMRGDTDLYQILSAMQQASSLFIGPDSGLLNMLYYLDVQKKMHLVSFWANTRVGLLHQGVKSPNKLLTHNAVIAPNQDLSQLEASLMTSHVKDMSLTHALYLAERMDDLSLINQETYSNYQRLKNASSEKPPLFNNIQNPSHHEIAPSFIFSHKICPIILAGGHGTRLNFHLPKALFEVGGKTLLEHFIDKIKLANTHFDTSLDVILMVSKDGYDPIFSFLKTHQFFGLNPDKFHIIIQKHLPFLTLDHKLVLKDEKSIYEGPDGNGDIFSLLEENGLFDRVDDKITGFEIIPIDNPLAPVFLHHHAKAFDEGYEVSMLSIKTEDATEKFGKVCLHDEGVSIIEYTQNPPPHLNIANTGLLAFEKSFAKSLASKPLPLHTALKTYLCFNGKNYEELTVKKFETFIFDHLKWAKKIKIFTTCRSCIFQPLKEKQGPYGIKAVEQALHMAHEKSAIVQQGEL
jgi:UDP-N-acetylglucosamine pyrophosphorylase